MTDLCADCARCEGLCCVVLAFDESPAFAFTKPLNTPCQHLSDENRCKIHRRRGEIGFGGCCDYDCHGAGQRATALVPGRSWREDPERARALFGTFCTLLELHELLLLLGAATRLDLPLWAETERRRLFEQAESDAARLPSVVPDVARHRQAIHAFLRKLLPSTPQVRRRALPVWRSSAPRTPLQTGTSPDSSR